jgi:hypothetical protein
MVMVFTGLASKSVAMVSDGLASKPDATVSDSLTSKSAAMVSVSLGSKSVVTVFSGLASKSVSAVFSSLGSKLVATVSPGLALKPAVGFLVELQNQGGEGFPGLNLKTASYGLMICDSKSPRQFLGLGLLRFIGCATKSMEEGQRGTCVEI